MSSARAAAVKVGLFTLLSLSLFFGVVYWLESRKLKTGQAYTVAFPDVDGLREGAPVQLMGTRVGFIEDITPIEKDEHYRVNVKFRLTDHKHPIPKASVLSIEQSGLISEKLLEISPPQLSIADVETTQVTLLDNTPPPFPLTLRSEGGWLPIGQVERVERLKAPPSSPLFEKRKYNGYRLYYRVTKPGVLLPNVPYYLLNKDAKSGASLRVDSYDPDWRPPSAPRADVFFTVEPPLRLKEFLEIQIASAEALKETNDKINALLDAKTIGTVQDIIGNIKTLSGQSKTLIHSTQALLNTLNHDLKDIGPAVVRLSTSVNRLIDNVNTLVEDPELKQEAKALIADLRQVILRAQAMLEDPELQGIIHKANQALSDGQDVLSLAKTKLENEQITTKLETTLTELNEILVKANTLTEGEDNPLKKEALQTVVKDATVTLKNLRAFSEKLQGHFVLWKLAF